MTPRILLEELKEVVQKATAKLDLKNPDGEKTVLNVFFQDLPKPETDEDADPYPYCIIRVVNGTSNAVDEDKNKIRVLLIIGIYDNDLKNNGHITVLSIIQKIIDRFSKNNEMKTFIQSGDIEWAVDDEDAFPYFVGGIDMTFIPTMFTRRELEQYL